MNGETPPPVVAESCTLFTPPYSALREPHVQIDDLFTASQKAVVARLYHRDQEERQAGSTDPLRLKAVSPQVAHFLCFTAIHLQARTLVEFGTSHGYSTFHLAAAAQRMEGRVFTLDKVPEKTAAARANLREAGLDHLVECHTGEGNPFIRSLPRQVDFVFVDFGLPSFAPMFPRLEPRLARGAFLFVDGWSRAEPWEANPTWAAFKSRLDGEHNDLTHILHLEKSNLVAIKLV